MLNDAMGRVRDYIALIMTIGILLMIAFKVAMPDRIWDIYMMVIAFFFGSKQNVPTESQSPEFPSINPTKTSIQEAKP